MTSRKRAFLSSPFEHLGPCVPLWGLRQKGRIAMATRAPDHDAAEAIFAGCEGEIVPDPSRLIRDHLYTFVGGSLSPDVPVWRCPIYVPEGLPCSFFICKDRSFFDARARFRKARETYHRSVDRIDEGAIAQIGEEELAALRLLLAP